MSSLTSGKANLQILSLKMGGGREGEGEGEGVKKTKKETPGKTY